MARPPRLPALRLRRAAPRPRRDGRRTGGQGRRDALDRGRGGRAAGRGRSRGRGRRSVERGRSPASPSARATWWLPTARTPASAGRSGPPATAPIPSGWPCAGYFTSPLHDDPWIESHLDIRDKAGNHLPGYGWIFPVGDGTVNVGVGLLSTFSGWKDVNTSHLMDAFCETAPERWGISPETSCGPPTGGKLPTGGLGRDRRSARPGSSWATPPAR